MQQVTLTSTGVCCSAWQHRTLQMQTRQHRQTCHYSNLTAQLV